MKQLLPTLLISISFISCEKNISPVSDNQAIDSIMLDVLEDTIHLSFIERIVEEKFVTSMAFDNDSSLWIGTFQDGLYKCKDNLVTKVDVSLKTSYRAIDIDSKNNVWMATDDGIMKLKGNDVEFFNPDNSDLPNYSVSTLFISSQNKVYASVLDHIIIINNGNWQVLSNENSNFGGHITSNFVEDENENIWFPGLTVLYKLHDTSITVFERKSLGIQDYFGLMDVLDGPNTVKLSNNDIMGCIYLYSSVSFPITPLFYKKSLNRSTIYHCSSKWVQIDKLAADNKDNVWCIARYNSIGADLYHFDGSKLRSIQSPVLFPSVYSIVFDAQNRVYIGTTSGVFVFEAVD